MAKQLDLAKFWGKQRINASKIWDHFGFHKDERGNIKDKSVAVCKYCGAEMKYQKGSTSNLQYHFNNFHLAASTQPSIASSFGQAKKYSRGSMRHTTLQKSVADFLIDDLRPFSTVESPAFIKLVGDLDPKFQLDSAKTFSSTVIPKMYTDLRRKVAEMLKPVPVLGITSDGWTSIATQSYITITAHFLDSNWNMKSLGLQTKHYTDSHTAENLKELYQEAFKEWEIEEKEIIGCVDNARNVVNSWKLMERPCMFCFGHIMNLSVKKGLAVIGIDGILQRCRKLVGHFNHSSLAKESLKNKQRQLGKAEKSLKQDVDTY